MPSPVEEIGGPAAAGRQQFTLLALTEDAVILELLERVRAGSREPAIEVHTDTLANVGPGAPSVQGADVLLLDAETGDEATAETVRKWRRSGPYRIILLVPDSLAGASSDLIARGADDVVSKSGLDAVGLRRSILYVLAEIGRRRAESRLQQETQRLAAANRQIEEARSETAEVKAGLEAAEERLRRLANTDALTGISTRASLFGQCQKELSRLSRHDGCLGLVLLDIDHFREVNNRCGYLLGDDALRRVAQRLQDSIRQYDLAARFDGEEFAVLLPQADPESALRVAHRSVQTIREISLRFEGDRTISLSASAGVAVVQSNEQISVEELMHRAEEALAQAKREGGNRAVGAHQLPPEKGAAGSSATS